MRQDTKLICWCKDFSWKHTFSAEPWRHRHEGTERKTLEQTEKNEHNHYKNIVAEKQTHKKTPKPQKQNKTKKTNQTNKQTPNPHHSLCIRSAQGEEQAALRPYKKLFSKTICSYLE